MNPRKSLHRSEERFRQAAEAGNVFACDWSISTDVVMGPGESAQILGIDDATPTTVEQLLAKVHPDDRERLVAAIAELSPEQPHLQVTYQSVRPDGTVIWVQRNGRAHFDEQGKIIRIVGTVMDVTERKLAEAGLRQKEMELSEAQRLAQIGSWEWDPNTDIVTWSRELYRITGRDPNQPAVSYEGHSQLLTAESWERLQRSVEEALRGGTPYELDLEYVRPDGSTIWARARGEVQRDGTGRVVRLRGTAQDITRRKLAESALNLANDRLRLALDAAKSVGWDRDVKTGRDTLFGDLQSMFGIPSEVHDGRVEDFHRYLHPSDRGRVLEAINDAMESKKPYAAEFRILWLDGTVHWVAARGKFYYSPEGEPERMLGISVDITERKLAERDLRESEERLRLAAQAGKMYAFDWDTASDVIIRSDAVTHIPDLAGEPTYLKKQQLLARVHPEDRATFVNSITECTPKNPNTRIMYRLLNADGSILWLERSGHAFFDEQGRMVRMIGMVADITERKQSEQKLLDANEHLREANERIEKLKEQLEHENLYLKKEITVQLSHHEVVGRSEAIRRVLMKAEQVAPANTAVLLLGETGTGKELLARAIHRNSKRKDRLMVKVNCAALPASLVENELFGREKGAYTGALTREIGRFELANESTIFLDEIGELPLELQAKLLRVLQEGEFERLGSSRTMHVNVRVIAATSRDLETAVREGKFREDLYYRLNVFPIRIPPLRERREDIPMLTWHFLRDLGRRMGREIESVRATTMTAFQNYSWPGNVRELRNVIERHLITNQGPAFEAELPEAIHTSAFVEGTAEESERNHIRLVLERSGWRVRGQGGAAELLALKPTTLESRMKKLGIVRQ
jgi:formate hydrogenlyase transcriptional activator